MPGSTSSDYRLSPALGARLMGTLLVILAVALFAATALVALLHLPLDLLVVLAVLGLVGVFVVGYALRKKYVVHLDDEGYRVRLVRGAGVSEASWKDVEEVVAASPRGIDCLVLRLSDGRTTTIPVSAVAADRDDFARDVRDHARRGEGLRPL
ncbi:hypothetical protein [Nocardioides ungokensis]